MRPSPWLSPRSGLVSTSLVGGLGRGSAVVRSALALDEAHEIAEGEVHVAEVQPPGRAEGVADSGSRVAGAADVVDLEPGRAAALLTLARVQLRQRDPRGGKRDRRMVVLTERARERLRREVRLEVTGTAGDRRRVHAQHLERAPGRARSARADTRTDPTEQAVRRRGVIEAR